MRLDYSRNLKTATNSKSSVYMQYQHKRKTSTATLLFKRSKCEECGKSFRKIEEFMQHQQVVHGKDKCYRCNSCGLEYFGMEQMRAHIMKLHRYTNKKV